MRNFDLELTFERSGPLSEDIEDQLAAIDHPELQLIFEVACLRGTERVIENRHGGAAFVGKVANFGSLASPDEGARIDRLELLRDLAGDFGSGALGQGTQLGKRIFGSDSTCG